MPEGYRATIRNKRDADIEIEVQVTSVAELVTLIRELGQQHSDNRVTPHMRNNEVPHVSVQPRNPAGNRFAPRNGMPQKDCVVDALRTLNREVSTRELIDATLQHPSFHSESEKPDSIIRWYITHENGKRIEKTEGGKWRMKASTAEANSSEPPPN